MAAGLTLLPALTPERDATKAKKRNTSPEPACILRKDLPAGLRDPVESILARIHWVDQKWHEQRKREAEERKLQEEREVF